MSTDTLDPVNTPVTTRRPKTTPETFVLKEVPEHIWMNEGQLESTNTFLKAVSGKGNKFLENNTQVVRALVNSLPVTIKDLVSNRVTQHQITPREERTKSFMEVCAEFVSGLIANHITEDEKYKPASARAQGVKTKLSTIVAYYLTAEGDKIEVTREVFFETVKTTGSFPQISNVEEAAMNIRQFWKDYKQEADNDFEKAYGIPTVRPRLKKEPAGINAIGNPPVE